MFVACEDDFVDKNAPSSNSDSDITVRAKGDNVKSNGRWLSVPSHEAYANLYNYLSIIDNKDYGDEKAVILVEDEKGKYGTTYDPNPALAQWERAQDHESLRRRLLLEEDAGLRAGMDPGDLFHTADDRDITDVIDQTLASKEGVVQIGTTIRYAVTPSLTIEVLNDNEGLMNQILDEGTSVISDDNLDDIRVVTSKSFSGVKDCTAEFGVFKGVVLEEENKARYTFLWNMGDIAGAIDPVFTWTIDGVATTSTTPFLFHVFDNLTAGQANSFNVCLTAKYTIVDEEGVETQCENSSCQTVTIEYDEPVDEPLFTCDDAQIVASLLETFGIGNLLDLTPTPGNAEQVCVNASNLLLGSAALLDALTFEWTFQNQSGTGINVCFTAPCDGTYDLTLVIKLADGTTCIAISEEYHHHVEANCQGLTDRQFKEDFPYTLGGKSCKVTFRAKHQTKLDNGFLNWNKNQIETQQTSYKKKWGFWFKTSRRHEIRLEGNVYPSGDACYCEGTPDYLNPNIDFRIKTEKNTKYYKQMFPDSDGIFCKVNDPYKVTFNEANGIIVQSYEFPQ